MHFDYLIPVFPKGEKLYGIFKKSLGSFNLHFINQLRTSRAADEPSSLLPEYHSKS